MSAKIYQLSNARAALRPDPMVTFKNVVTAAIVAMRGAGVITNGEMAIVLDELAEELLARSEE
jgi:hypothetical protein